MKITEIKYNENLKTALQDIIESFQDLKTYNIKDFKKEETLIIHIDIVNGFLKSGTLSSEHNLNILNYIINLNNISKDYNKVFIEDTHTEDSVELNFYPFHCVIGTKENKLVDELKPFCKHVIQKNSTNLIHIKEFVGLLNNYKNFIVVGVVSDICILQGALSIRTYLNEINKDSRVIVPINAIDTFDADNHNRMLMNIFSLYNLRLNGVEIIEKII